MTIPSGKTAQATLTAAEAAARLRDEIAAAATEISGGKEWRKQAACRDADPEIFFDLRPDSEATARALSHCAGCPVTGPCGEFGRTVRAPGVWGGQWNPDPVSSPVQYRRRVK